MKFKNRKKSLIVVINLLSILLIGSGNLLAQVPQAFYFESIVLDTDDSPLVNQNIGVEINLLEGSPSGTVVYSESQEVTSNTIGNIQIAVGTGNTTIGQIEDLDWENNAYFIQVSTDISGGSNYTLLSTSQLLAVPYALLAYNLHGATGATGAQGLAGPAGANGADGAAGPAGPAGAVAASGAQGADGLPGLSTDGIKCWDLNADGLFDDSEDINQNGIIDLDDCEGPIGAQGPAASAVLQGPAGPAGAEAEVIHWEGINTIGETWTSPETAYYNEGNIGIGTTTPSCLLDVSGDICANGMALNSDRRYKKDILPLENSLSSIQQMRGVRYLFDLDLFPTKNFSEAAQIGLIAQEVEAVFPELVTTNAEGYKAVNYVQLTPVLLEAIKELSEQKTALEAYKQERFEALQRQFDEFILDAGSEQVAKNAESEKTD